MPRADSTVNDWGSSRALSSIRGSAPVEVASTVITASADNDSVMGESEKLAMTRVLFER
jgi:hypothetical protein